MLKRFIDSWQVNPAVLFSSIAVILLIIFFEVVFPAGTDHIFDLIKSSI